MIFLALAFLFSIQETFGISYERRFGIKRLENFQYFISIFAKLAIN